jgi:hypothetical protein
MLKSKLTYNLGALARNQLELNDKEGPWGSKSPFVHEEDHNRHVKPDRGGRMELDYV